MSLGINLLLGLVEQVAQRLGPDWDIEIMELHHRGKVDAPSGTALALGRAAASARGAASMRSAQRGRDGITGPRRAGDIGFRRAARRRRVGDHHVIFAGPGERLELVHRATNRAIYAKGAVPRGPLAARPPARALRHEGRSSGFSSGTPALPGAMAWLLSGGVSRR